jgi:S-phase kinase-associated protein 1
MNPNNSIKIVTKEGTKISLTKKSAQLSALLKSTIQDFGDENELKVPLSDIDERTANKVVEYLDHWNGSLPAEMEKPLKSSEMKDVTDEWSANFVDSLAMEELVDLTVAANFMEIQQLLDLTCAKIASMCKDKTEEEIFKTFGVTDTFTEEEKAKIREENKWIEDNL